MEQSATAIPSAASVAILTPAATSPSDTGGPALQKKSNTALINFIYRLTVYSVLAVLITPITYRVSLAAGEIIKTIVHDRESVIYNGVSFSPVTFLTRLSERTTTEELTINNYDFVAVVPDTIGNLTNLKRLNIFYNPIRALPPAVGNLTSLETIRIQNTLLTSLPSTLANNYNLVDISLQGNKISHLPDIFDSMQKLQTLNLAHNNLTSLPPSISNLSQLILLDLTGNKLTSVPQNLPPILEVIYLGGNPIPIDDLVALQKRNRMTDLIIYY